MIIFRIEHGRINAGPFRMSAYCEVANLKHCHDMFRRIFYLCNRHGGHLPTPSEDSIDELSDDYIIGVLYFSSLRMWFPTDKHSLRRLHKAGFKIKEYDVPREFCKTGSHQVAFNFKKATLKAEYSPLKLAA